MNKPYSYFDRLRRARPTKARRRQSVPTAPKVALRAVEQHAAVVDPEPAIRITHSQPVAEF